MTLPLLDRLERLHAEYGRGDSVYDMAALRSVPALVAALRLAVEALEHAKHRNHDYSDGCDGCCALAKIESLMATEEATP